MLICLPALRTDTFIIELHFIHLMPLSLKVRRHKGCLFLVQVIDFPALTAEEMHMRLHLPVVANAVVIDGNHCCSALLCKHSKRIVNGSLT